MPRPEDAQSERKLDISSYSSHENYWQMNPSDDSYGRTYDFGSHSEGTDPGTIQGVSFGFVEGGSGPSSIVNIDESDFLSVELISASDRERDMRFQFTTLVHAFGFEYNLSEGPSGLELFIEESGCTTTADVTIDG